jgi:cation diffusion facilitator CzcD-associated flavoprotein CzcO
MPGHVFPGDPDNFASRDEVVRFLDGYASTIRAPLRCGVRVTTLRAKRGTERLVVRTDHGTLEAVNVVFATGPFQEPVIPPFGHHSRPRSSRSRPTDIRTRPNSRPAPSSSWDPRPPAVRSLSLR